LNEVKTILCYGDSNTWGYIPGTSERLPFAARWTGRLQSSLGSRYHVIEEGLNGRTTVWDDPYKPARNGLKTLRPILDSHTPLDLVILMLGTNDLKHYFSAHAPDCARGVALLVEAIRQSLYAGSPYAPRILLISPPHIRGLSPLLQLQFRGAEEKSLEFAEHYEQLAQEAGCLFLDAAEIVEPSEKDGVHLEPEGHEKLAEAICAVVVSVQSKV
jgi:lysophospholipase L1-like esterase